MEMKLLNDFNAPKGPARLFYASDSARRAHASAPDLGIPPSEIQRAALDSSLDQSAYMRGNAVRILGVAFKVFDHYDDAAFCKACETHLRRHDVYHTGFHYRNGDWASRTVAPADIELAGESVTVDPEASDQSFAALIDARQPRIPDWDLFSFSALGIENASAEAENPEFTVAVCLDHLLTDGFSIFMIFEEIMMFYEAFRAGADRVEELPLQALHADYARRDAAYCAQLSADSPQVQEWERFKALHDGALPDFPFATGLSDSSDFAPGCMTSIPDFLSVAESEAFEQVCKQANGSLSAGFMAVAALIDRLVRGSDTFTICTPRSTRSTPAEHYTMGWFAHPVPLEFPIADRFADTVAAARQANKAVRFMVGVPIYPAQKVIDPTLSSMPPEMTSLSFIDTRLIPTFRDLSAHAYTVIGTRRNAKSVHYWVNRVGHGTNLNFMHPYTPEMAAGLPAFADLFRQIVDTVIATGDCDLAAERQRWQALVDSYEATPAPLIRAAA
ncbi:condensation domain-containing protein [Salinisphaera sp. T5B8]|uniref:condensation domain-containing protein n=1 Tax=Salinisphaera sp. T5B8 TaxID=1304154 RepID=UPI00333E2F37